MVCSSEQERALTAKKSAAVHVPAPSTAYDTAGGNDVMAVLADDSAGLRAATVAAAKAAALFAVTAAGAAAACTATAGLRLRQLTAEPWTATAQRK
jgi:hypothetical protein